VKIRTAKRVLADPLRLSSGYSIRVSTGLVAFALLLAAGAIPAITYAADAKPGGIKVEVTGFRNDKGQLGCSLWPGPEGFPRDDSHILGHLWAPIRGGRGECFFAGVPAGDYAVTLFHDENSNGKFDSNFVGYPLEGYGFSNNAKAMFKAPSFDECKFHYDGNGTKQIPVQMIYR
jgi:uncharacterized protein (DUF2141 family)